MAAKRLDSAESDPRANVRAHSFCPHHPYFDPTTISSLANSPLFSVSLAWPRLLNAKVAEGAEWSHAGLCVLRVLRV